MNLPFYYYTHSKEIQINFGPFSGVRILKDKITDKYRLAQPLNIENPKVEYGFLWALNIYPDYWEYSICSLLHKERVRKIKISFNKDTISLQNILAIPDQNDPEEIIRQEYINESNSLKYEKFYRILHSVPYTQYQDDIIIDDKIIINRKTLHVKFECKGCPREGLPLDINSPKKMTTEELECAKNMLSPEAFLEFTNQHQLKNPNSPITLYKMGYFDFLKYREITDMSKNEWIAPTVKSDTYFLLGRMVGTKDVPKDRVVFNILQYALDTASGSGILRLREKPC